MMIIMADRGMKK